ncbi:MAG: transporter substrate-binding domain-containing protein [Desulfobacterales bacterium]|nr:transporter substrate-binding domain-containing protein [Desulfobacterales bacterium]MCP4159329.1 transporter substrate-binding domain-containing protein [Deltaproteobacteria bacterium]
MKSRLIITLTILFTISVIFVANPIAADAKTLLIGIDVQDNFPSIGPTGTENGLNPGIFIEEMRYIEKKANINFKYKRIPWKKCLINLKRGKLDGVVCGSYKKERGVFPMTSAGKPDSKRRFSDSSYYLYVKKDSDLKWNGKKFNKRNIRIGAQLGFSIVAVLKKLGVRVDEVTSIKINFRKLMKGRIIGLAAHEDSGDAAMVDYSNVKKLKIPLKTKSYYFIMSHQIFKSNPKLVNKIWKACATLQGKKLKKMKAKYRGKKGWADLK